VRGYLQGFIDLVFRSGGRYYIVDWKSNYLGPSVDHYPASAMDEAMGRHSYRLQYTLYVAALHRYLAARDADYSYDRSFGGVYYVFVRGVSPEHPGYGIHYARPGEALVQDVCAWLDGGA